MQSNQNNPLIYWEKQADDKLCGLHCLNSSLQAPIYNEITLSQLAMELNKNEIHSSLNYSGINSG